MRTVSITPLAVGVCLAWSGAATTPGWSQPTDDESQRPAVLLETSDAYFTTELVSTSPYAYQVGFTAYFKPRASESSVAVTLATAQPGKSGPIRRRVQVATLEDTGRLGSLTLQACVDVGCRPLPFRPTVLAARAGVRIDIDERAWAPGPRASEDVRLTAPEDWVRVAGSRPSPALSVVLPQLGETERNFLGARPTLAFSVSPLSKDQTADRPNATTLTFEGAFRHFRSADQLALTYSGQVSTDASVSFNNLKASLEYERNLLRRDFVPMRIFGGIESDQSFDLSNVVSGVRLGALLPINVNLSPRDEGYIVNTGPIVEGRFEAGKRTSQDKTDTATANAPEKFVRAGYEVRWRVPVARNTVLHLHHAGEWVWPEAKGAATFHPLWDLALETKIGNLIYFLGYQKGEAAPLYQAVETAQAGVSIRFR